MVELLLAAEARVDDAGPDGKTALMFAAMFDRTEIVTALLAPRAPAPTGSTARAVAHSTTPPRWAPGAPPRPDSSAPLTLPLPSGEREAAVRAPAPPAQS